MTGSYCCCLPDDEYGSTLLNCCCCLPRVVRTDCTPMICHDPPCSSCIRCWIRPSRCFVHCYCCCYNCSCLRLRCVRPGPTRREIRDPARCTAGPRTSHHYRAAVDPGESGLHSCCINHDGVVDDGGDRDAGGYGYGSGDCKPSFSSGSLLLNQQLELTVNTSMALKRFYFCRKYYEAS